MSASTCRPVWLRFLYAPPSLSADDRYSPSLHGMVHDDGNDDPNNHGWLAHNKQVVSLAPRYVIVNAMDRAIEVQQAGLNADVEPLKVR